MTIRRLYVDCFSSKLGEKQHGNAGAVLAEAARTGRFSTFEMTGKLHRTLCALVAAGRIDEHPAAYPWHCYSVKEPPGEPASP
jgi:hypothetical protein